MRVIGQMGTDEDPTLIIDVDGENLVLASKGGVGEPQDGARWMKFQGGYVQNVTAPQETIDLIFEAAQAKLGG